jgi:hypothetical protein
LSATSPGGITTTAPTTIGHVVKPVFFADSATSGFVLVLRGTVVGDPVTNPVSVNDQLDFTVAEPAAPATNSIYIATATGTSNVTSTPVVANRLYRWSGTAWIATIPGDGWLAYDQSDNKIYTFNDGTTWAAVGGGLSDGDYGDIAVGGGGTTLTIDNDAVTFAKQADIGALTVVANPTNASADPQAVAIAANEVLKNSGSNTLVSGKILPERNVTFTQQTLTDGATINWDMSSGLNAVVTLGGNRTLAAPTNMPVGATCYIIVKQDPTGNRTLTWNAVFKWPSGVAPVLSTAVNAVDVFCVYVESATLLRSVYYSWDSK